MKREEKLYALAQLAGREALTAVAEFDRAEYLSRHDLAIERDRWQRRLQKIVLRVHRANDRFYAARAAHDAEHQATCEECALHRISSKLAAEIVADIAVNGDIPVEERN
jgi:hypothetical protein